VADLVRVDRWLCAARFFGSRTQAHTACDKGRISINSVKVKASHAVKVGDEVSGKTPRGIIVVDVLVLSEKRLAPALARELYRDRSPPPPPRDERVWRRR
jgi:ribosome-associated heat shock protein Hsp15